MDGAQSSPYPHFSWLVLPLAVRPPRLIDVFECRHVTHHLVLATAGHADVRWTTQGAEQDFQTGSGDAGFFPCDREEHTLILKSADGFRACVLCLPDHHLQHVSTSDGLPPPGMFRPLPAFRDALLRACILRLVPESGDCEVADDIGTEIAARRIILRLCELVGGVQPDWLDDASIFTPSVMRRIVARIDAELRLHTTLEDLAAQFGLSPSHFARKFHHSAGVSVNRFMNRRRIRMSFRMLQDDSISLSGLSLDLGFSSQSHFTRMFSGLTGMTPNHYRRLHRRTSG